MLKALEVAAWSSNGCSWEVQRIAERLGTTSRDDSQDRRLKMTLTFAGVSIELLHQCIRDRVKVCRDGQDVRGKGGIHGLCQVAAQGRTGVRTVPARVRLRFICTRHKGTRAIDTDCVLELVVHTVACYS